MKKLVCVAFSELPFKHNIILSPRFFLRSSYRPSETEPTTTHSSPVVGSTATAAAAVTAVPSVGTYTINYYNCNYTRFLTHQNLHSSVFSSTTSRWAALSLRPAATSPSSSSACCISVSTTVLQDTRRSGLACFSLREILLQLDQPSLYSTS